MLNNCQTIKSLLPHLDQYNRYLMNDGSKYYYSPEASCYDITQYFCYIQLKNIKDLVLSLAAAKNISSLEYKLTSSYLQELPLLSLLKEVKSYIPVEQSFASYLTKIQNTYDLYSSIYPNKFIDGEKAATYIVEQIVSYFDLLIYPSHPNISNISNISKGHLLITTRIGVDIDQYRDVLGMKTIEIMHPGYIHLHKAQKSIYSQFEQDGIIEAIFDLISTDNKVYIEIGGGSVNDNSYNLLMNGWNGYAINSGQYFMNEKTQNLQVINQLVTKENVNNILDELDGLPKDFDFLSIDIDSHDLAIWKAMDNLYCPKVVAMEFNSNFPMGVHAAINEDNTKFIWDGYSKNYGASFTSIVTAAKEKGYTYAYHLPFTDVFFVRNDVMPEKLKGIEPEDTFDSYPLHFPSFINQYDFVFGLNNEFLNEYSNGIVEEDFYKVLLHF